MTDNMRTLRLDPNIVVTQGIRDALVTIVAEIAARIRVEYEVPSDPMCQVMAIELIKIGIGNLQLGIAREAGIASEHVADIDDEEGEGKVRH